MGDIKEDLTNSRFRFHVSSFRQVAAIAAIVLILVTLILIYVPVSISKTEVVIEKGEGLGEIAGLLKEKEVIISRNFFVFYANALGKGDNLKAGKYVFEGRLSLNQVLVKIIKGDSKPEDVEITIPEGSNVWEIDEILTRAELIKQGDFAVTAIDYEGSLFPDTYRLRNFQFPIINFQTSFNDSISKQKELAAELVKKMLNNFEEKTQHIFKNLNIEKQKEIIIIASILEKEAKTEEDMRLVAGVIKNRLEKGMLLQIDATVAYGVCYQQALGFRLQASSFKYCDVSQVGIVNEIKIDGPYNTYIRAGLTPGPISNSGLKALEAALNPADTDYLYYLSTRDGSQVIFSKTAAEHGANRLKYLRI